MMDCRSPSPPIRRRADDPAIAIYRDRFNRRVCSTTARHVGVHVVAADTMTKPVLASSGRQAFANLRSGMPTTLPPPSREFEKEVVPFRAPSSGDAVRLDRRLTGNRGHDLRASSTARRDEGYRVSHITTTPRGCGRTKSLRRLRGRPKAQVDPFVPLS